MLDILGVGFGPSNLALAACIQDTIESRKNDGYPELKSMFFDRQDSFHWHKDMLIDGATMQISFLKDLVTLRDPTSRFSFLNYLKSQCRLEDFINLKTFHPTRMEYAGYLKWVSAQLANHVKFGCCVEDVHLGIRYGDKQCIEVAVRNLSTNEIKTYATQNLVLGTGLRPKLPKAISESERVVHSSSFLSLLDRLDSADQKRFLVVGGGQSAAEIVSHLYDRHQAAEIVAVFPTFGYKPADDSHFVNQIFDPKFVDLFYTAPDDVRSLLLKRHADTNYSVVDSNLIGDLYRKVYSDKVKGYQRLDMRRLSRLEGLLPNGKVVLASIRDLCRGVVTEEIFDAVVLATGYHPPSLTETVPTVAPYVTYDAFGEVILDRNYAVKTNAPIGGCIYLQGASESQHGFTVTLLSALAIRSQEILEDIIKRRENYRSSFEQEVGDAV